MKSIGEIAKSLGTGIVTMFKRLPFAFYILAHPFDGFYELKNDPRRHNLPGAVFLFLVLALTSIMKRQLTGYLFTEPFAQMNLNVPYEIAIAVLPFILFSASEGSMSRKIRSRGRGKNWLSASGILGSQLML